MNNAPEQAPAQPVQITPQMALDNFRQLCASPDVRLNLQTHAILQESLKVFETLVKGKAPSEIVSEILNDSRSKTAKK